MHTQCGKLSEHGPARLGIVKVVIYFIILNIETPLDWLMEVFLNIYSGFMSVQKLMKVSV